MSDITSWMPQWVWWLFGALCAVQLGMMLYNAWQRREIERLLAARLQACEDDESE